MNKHWGIAASVSGLVAVALGAFGAHGLKPHLSPDALQWFETANRYHFYHTLALLAVALLMQEHTNGKLRYAAVAFLTGSVLFSGSLYLMAVTQWKFLGPVTPLGGLAFLAGWLLLAWSFVENKKTD